MAQRCYPSVAEELATRLQFKKMEKSNAAAEKDGEGLSLCDSAAAHVEWQGPGASSTGKILLPLGLPRSAYLWAMYVTIRLRNPAPAKKNGPWWEKGGIERGRRRSILSRRWLSQVASAFENSTPWFKAAMALPTIVVGCRPALDTPHKAR